MNRYERYVHRESLNRSLSRLGQMQARIYPMVMIENELAIAVRRAGIVAVARALVGQWWMNWSLRRSARNSWRGF